MTSYTYDEKSLFKDGKRWFPVMGEIHYSRYPQQYWKEALLKMKEGGVDIVSSYVIWIHHEEIENQWDWSGERNLRQFVETIKDCGLKMILRVGPWSHAEVRNGGFPDWLLTKCPKYRSNDESYFAEVEKFYRETFNQVKGLLLKDGGPIIGLQIENEFGHCGGLTGAEGELHMNRLTQMVKDIGFDVPIYTATGWGGAITAGLLPVMGGYCEAPWDPRITEIEPSGNYVFTYERNDHAIGSDYGLGEGITFDMSKYPYLTAELGGGLQVTYKRRPVARGKDIGGMSLAKIGSGCNLLGYYMYHGGTNPEGKLTTLEENTATGSINDLPVKNYDFRAPLGEYGKTNETYDEVKLYTLFVHDFGQQLCSTDTYLPKDNPVKPEDFESLRSSWRFDGEKSGFVFVNNFQRRNKMSCHENVQLAFDDKEKLDVVFPAVDVKDGDMFFLPFNMKVGNALLKTSLATPLCKINGDYVFYSAAAPAGKSASSKSTVKTVSQADKTLYQFEGTGDSKIVTLTKADALKAHKIFSNGKEYLVVTNAELIQEEKNGRAEVTLFAKSDVVVKAFPALENVPAGFTKQSDEEGFAVYTKKVEPCTEEAKVKIISEGEKITAEITTPSYDCSDMLVHIDYTGNCAKLFQQEKLIDDSIYIGPEFSWTVCLKRYGNKENTFTVQIESLFAEQKNKIFLEQWPEISGEKVCALNSVKLEKEYAFSFEV